MYVLDKSSLRRDEGIQVSESGHSAPRTRFVDLSVRYFNSTTRDSSGSTDTVLADTPQWTPAREDLKIHVEAANPDNFITKAEARTLTKQVAYVLRHRYGIGASGPGKDVVLSTSSGSPFLPCIFYGIVGAGGVYSGASTAFQTSELVRQVNDADAKVLICSSEYEIHSILAARQCNISLDRVLVIDSSKSKQWKLRSAADQAVVYQQGLSVDQLDWPRLATQQDLEQTTTCLLYSSGTTGLPKGVLLSHWNLLADNVCAMSVANAHRARCKAQGREFFFSTIAHLPMAHIAGIDMYSTNPFYMGGTTYWMKNFEFDSFIEYHRRYRPTFQFSVPPIWLQVAKSPKVADHFDGIEVAQAGAAPLGPEVALEVRKKLGKGKVWLVQTYGTTETTGTITAMDWTLRDETFSVGDICPNTRIRILDDDNNDVKSGQPGELLVGGPIVSSLGYHKRPEANQEAFVDGFYRTGDIGLWKDGLVYVVDRKKELIKYKGMQVAPAELEAFLNSHERVLDAAVIGVWDASQATELPRAYVVPKLPTGEEPALTIEDVDIFVRENLARHKWLRGGIVFLREIPKSASGKILRKELRVRAAEEMPKAKL